MDRFQDYSLGEISKKIISIDYSKILPNARPSSKMASVMKLYQRIKTFLQGIVLSKYTAPVVLVGVSFLAFGLLMPALGFYWDDWPVVYLGKIHGNFWQYYISDRPFMAWPDLTFLLVAGENPLRWQALSLLTRIATILSFWWCLNLLWPKAKPQTFSAALLFSIYPIFFQQPMAITYKTHFMCLCIYLVSVALMLLALRKPRYFVLFMALALLTEAVQLATLEYFWGLELLRPVLLWIVVAEIKGTWKQYLKKVVLNWLPYLLLFGGVVGWHFFFLRFAEDRNAPTLLYSFFQTPISSAVKLFLMMLRDSISVLIGNWLEVFQVQTLDASSPMNLLAWGLAIFVIIVFWIYLRFLNHKGDENQQATHSWSRQALFMGIIALLVGMIPVWMTNRQVTVGMYSDRYAIPALVGASIFITGLIYTFLSKWSHRALVLATLVGLSVGLHFRIANEYRWDWTAQERFYWQLYWRAPAIKPGTSLLSESGLFQYVTKYSLATAINSLYPVAQGTTEVPYWAFELDDTNVTNLQDGANLYATLRTLTFSAPVKNSLVILYDRTNNSCLWVLSETDVYYQDLPPHTRDALYLSNLSRILPTSSDPTYPDKNIFGLEPEHSWCYFFEKADLARQSGDWETVNSLGNRVISDGYSPNNLYEWLPFIEGFLHTRNWDKAQSLTIDTFNSDQGNRAALCAVWSRSTETMTLSPAENETILSVQNELGCSVP